MALFLSGMGLCGALVWVAVCPPGCGDSDGGSIATCQSACDRVNDCVSSSNANLLFQPCDLCTTEYAEAFLNCVRTAGDCLTQRNCAQAYHNMLTGDGSVDAGP